MPHWPQTVSKAFRVSTAPVAPLLHTPLVMMARAVRVQMTMVSMKTSSTPYMP